MGEGVFKEIILFFPHIFLWTIIADLFLSAMWGMVEEESRAKWGPGLLTGFPLYKEITTFSNFCEF